MQNGTHREELRAVYQKTENNSDLTFIPARDKIDIFSTNHVFRTCAYCRVSTDSDEQLLSYELQKQHYQHLVGTHPNWDLQHVFADEGISGTSLKNRDEFNEMISDCLSGKYDLIVTKNVSRFARNSVDCVSLVRRLKNQNPPVGVFFESDSLFTLAEDSELKLSMLATFAQEESVKKSESMNWSLKERFKNKKLLTPELFGYRRPRDASDNFVKYGKLEIEESEAEVVRFIFNAFLAGYSTEKISSTLTEIGCRTKLGKTKWSDGSIGYILRNERYCGNVWTWKSFTADIFEHKRRKNDRDREQYLYENVHAPIISAEQFAAVQVLLENKKHGMRGGIPVMHVIDMGVFQGYVPINHHWINNDPEAYFKASNSVEGEKNAHKTPKKYFSAFDLTGYQVVRGQFMTYRLEMPCMTISHNKITFNGYCINKNNDIPYIQLLLHPTERKMAIRPCVKEDAYSIPWKINTKRPIATKTISCAHFNNALFQIMDWNPEYDYRIIGTLVVKGNNQIVTFNLSGAMPNTIICESDNSDGEERKKRVKFCPEEWGDTFGEDFYEFSMDNALYYSADDSNHNLYEKSKMVDKQLNFSLMTGEDLFESVEKIKSKMVTEYE